jgi:hypothetical protein
MTKLTDGDRSLALGTIDVGTSVYAARSERVVREPRASIP